MNALLLVLLAADPVVLQGALLWDGSGDPVRGDLLLRDGRIDAVGAVTAPAGALRIDASRSFVTPGLVALDTQIGTFEVELEPATVDIHPSEELAPAFRPADAFNPLSSWVAISRMGGVTTVGVAPRGSLIQGAVTAVALDGKLRRLPASLDAALVARIGGGEGSSRATQLMRLRDALGDAREYKAHRDEVQRNGWRPLRMGVRNLEALQPVIDGRMPLWVRTHRAADILAVLALAREEKVRVVIAGGSEAWRVAAELAADKVPVMLRTEDHGPDSFDQLLARPDNAALLERAGVTVALSAEGWLNNVRALRHDAGTAVAGGMTRNAALRALTAVPAQLLGFEASLKKGARADVVVWSGDPFETTTWAEHLFIEGAELPLRSRQTELYERYR